MSENRHLRSRLVLGLGAALFVLALLVAVFAGLLTAQQAATSATGHIDLAHLLRMTSLQAGLTTILSLTLGIALAWALNRLHFTGRATLIALFGAAIVTPGVVLAFGLISIWGRKGWINQLLEPFDLSLGGWIFGLGGILLAHVALDSTFAARVLLARLEAQPLTRLKMGQSLGLTPLQRFRVIDWPAIWGALPGLAAIIFLLAFTSFPIVLLLGGGPQNQTLEVAIYSAARLNFDLIGATQLALTQMGVCAIIILPTLAFMPSAAQTGGQTRLDWQDRGIAHTIQWVVLIVATFLFAAPLVAVIARGIGPGLIELAGQKGFWKALATSLSIGSISAALTLVLAMIVSLSRARATTSGLRMALGAPVYAYLAVPGIVLSLGFFLIARNLGVAPSLVAMPVVVLANTLLSLPFALSTLGPAADAATKRYDRLSRSLALGSVQRFLNVEWPLLRADAALVLALGFCFSLGDLSVIALFGSEDFTTLPWYMYRALGAYRNDSAAASASILLLLILLSFWGLPRLMQRLAHADR
jgi:thiamine transport system permease protein